jgi:Flp pilus assembly protein TadG
MTKLRLRRSSLPHPQDGSVTLWLLVMVVPLFAAVGLVVDGGSAMAAKATAISDAYGAARAGAQQLDLATYASTGDVVLDPAAARAAAESYLSAAGAPDAQVDVAGDQVRVSVSLASPTHLLDLVGLSTMTVSGRGSATATYGVREAGG